MVVTDTYPDRSRLASLYLIKDDKAKRLARVFVPFGYDNDLRCDLHPRWNRTGDKICFDAVLKGKEVFILLKLTTRIERDYYNGEN